MKRHSFLFTHFLSIKLLVSTFWLTPILACLLEAATPNVVFILADDLGYGDIGAYNPEGKIDTPNLDRMASEGLRFMDAHSAGSTCVPSRYGLLTGRWAARENMQWREGPVIKEDQPTIASMLQGNGYQTAMVGKWHQGFEMLGMNGQKKDFDYSQSITGGPVDRGFDTFFGMHASLDIVPFFYMSGREAILPPTKTVAASTSVGHSDGWNNIQGAFWRAGPIAPDFVHEEVTPKFLSEAENVIEQYGDSSKLKPLFLYLALPSPHTPWLPTKEFQGKSKVGMYGDFVMQVDAVVGSISNALEKAGMTEDTLLIFSSDNGPVWYAENTERFAHSSAGPLRGKKATAWEGAHRVPFMMRWPEKIKANSVSNHTLSFVDVFATLSDLIGASNSTAGAAPDSVSFLPAMWGKPIEARPPIVHDSGSIRAGNWKLIQPRGGKRASTGELYNLRQDLGEQNNQYETRPALVAKMSKQLESALSSPAHSEKNRDPDLRWRDVTKWGVEGRAWGDEPRARWFDRLPASAEKEVRDAVWKLSRDSAGMMVRFETDASEIWVDYKLMDDGISMPHMPATGVSGVDLYARDETGKWRWVMVTKPTTQEVRTSIIKNLAPGNREYAAYLPLYNGIDHLKIGVPKGASFKGLTPRKAKPIVFYGTSITHGACASRPGMVHTAILGRRLDQPVVNLGFSGNGRMEAEVGAMLTRIDAAVYVIDCNPNLGPDQVRERTIPLAKQVREARPQTPIILVEDRRNTNSWILPARNKHHDGNHEALQEAYKTLEAEGFKKLYYIHGDELLGNDGEGATDASHPNDLGFMRQADAFEPVLRKALGL